MWSRFSRLGLFIKRFRASDSSAKNKDKPNQERNESESRYFNKLNQIHSKEEHFRADVIETFIDRFELKKFPPVKSTRDVQEKHQFKHDLFQLKKKRNLTSGEDWKQIIRYAIDNKCSAYSLNGDMLSIVATKHLLSVFNGLYESDWRFHSNVADKRIFTTFEDLLSNHDWQMFDNHESLMKQGRRLSMIILNACLKGYFPTIHKSKLKLDDYIKVFGVDFKQDDIQYPEEVIKKLANMNAYPGVIVIRGCSLEKLIMAPGLDRCIMVYSVVDNLEEVCVDLKVNPRIGSSAVVMLPDIICVQGLISVKKFEELEKGTESGAKGSIKAGQSSIKSPDDDDDDDDAEEAVDVLMLLVLNVKNLPLVL